MEPEFKTEEDQVDAILAGFEECVNARVNGNFKTRNPSLNGIESFSRENQTRIAEAYIRFRPEDFAMNPERFDKIDQKQTILFLIENCGGMSHVAGQYLNRFKRLTPDDRREIAMTMIKKGPNHAWAVAFNINNFDPSNKKEIRITLIHNGYAMLVYRFSWMYPSRRDLDEETLTEMLRAIKNDDPALCRQIQNDLRWYQKILTPESIERLINL